MSFANASDYVTVPAGNYTVEVRPATVDNDGEVVATSNVSLEGGTAYSVLAIGYVDGFDSAMAQEFQTEVVEDATMTIHLPDEEEETVTPTAAATPTSIAGNAPPKKTTVGRNDPRSRCRGVPVLSRARSTRASTP